MDQNLNQSRLVRSRSMRVSRSASNHFGKFVDLRAQIFFDGKPIFRMPLSDEETNSLEFSTVPCLLEGVIDNLKKGLPPDTPQSFQKLTNELLSYLRATKSRINTYGPSPMMCTGDTALDQHSMTENTIDTAPKCFAPDTDNMIILSPTSSLVALLKVWRRMQPQRMAQRMKQAYMILSTRFDNDDRDKDLRLRDLGLMWKLLLRNSADIGDNGTMPLPCLRSFMRYIVRCLENHENVSDLSLVNVLMGALWALCHNQSACGAIFSKLKSTEAEDFVSHMLDTVETFNSLKTGNPVPQGLRLLNALLCLGNSYHTMQEKIPRVQCAVVGTIQHIKRLNALVSLAKTPEVAVMCSATLCTFFSSQASVKKLCTLLDTTSLSSSSIKSDPAIFKPLLTLLCRPERGFKSHKTSGPDLGGILTSALLMFNVAKHGGISLLGERCLINICGLIDWALSRLRIVLQCSGLKSPHSNPPEEQERIDIEVFGLRFSVRARKMFDCSVVAALQRVLLLAIGTAAFCMHHTAHVAKQCVAPQGFPLDSIVDIFLNTIQWCRDEASRSIVQMPPRTPDSDQESTPNSGERGLKQSGNTNGRESIEQRRRRNTSRESASATPSSTLLCGLDGRFDGGEDPAELNQTLTPAWVLETAEAGAFLALTRLFRYSSVRQSTFRRFSANPTPEFLPSFARCLVDFDACLSRGNRNLNIDLLTALFIVDAQIKPVVGPTTPDLVHFFGSLRQPITNGASATVDSQAGTATTNTCTTSDKSKIQENPELELASAAQYSLARRINPLELIPDIADLLAISPANEQTNTTIASHLGLLVLGLYHNPPYLPDNAILTLVLMANDCSLSLPEISLRLSQALWCLARDKKQRHKVVKCGAIKCLMTNAARTLAHIRKAKEFISKPSSSFALLASSAFPGLNSSGSSNSSKSIGDSNFKRRVTKVLIQEQNKPLSGQYLDAVFVSITTLWLLSYESKNWSVLLSDNLPSFCLAILDDLIIASLISDAKLVRYSANRLVQAQGTVNHPTRAALAATGEHPDVDKFFNSTDKPMDARAKQVYDDMRVIANYEKRMSIGVHCLKLMRLLSSIPTLLPKMKLPHVFQSLFTLAKTNTLQALGPSIISVGSVLDDFVQLTVRLRRLASSVLFSVPWPHVAIRDQGYVAIVTTFWTDILRAPPSRQQSSRSDLGLTGDVIKAEQVRQHAYACHLLANATFSTLGHDLIRSTGVLDKLVALALTRLHEDLDFQPSKRLDQNAGAAIQLALGRRREQALHALIALCMNTKSQEVLCARSLYKLFRITWATSNETTKRLCGILLKQICSNARNRTRLYKAEMRSRNIALDRVRPQRASLTSSTFQNSVNPNESLVGQYFGDGGEHKEEVASSCTLGSFSKVNKRAATTITVKRLSTRSLGTRSVKDRRFSSKTFLTSIDGDNAPNPDAELRARFCKWVDVELVKARTRVERIQARRKARKRRKQQKSVRQIENKKRHALQNAPDGQAGLLIWNELPFARRASAVLKPVHTPLMGVQHLIPRTKNCKDETIDRLDEKHGGEEKDEFHPRCDKGRGMRLTHDLCLPINKLWESEESKAMRRLPWDPLAVISQGQEEQVRIQVLNCFDNKPTFTFDHNVGDTFVKPGKARLNMWPHSQGSRVFETSKSKIRPFNVGSNNNNDSSTTDTKNNKARKKKRSTRLDGSEALVLSHSDALRYVQEARKELVAWDATQPNQRATSRAPGRERICKRATAAILADQHKAAMKAMKGKRKMIAIHDEETRSVKNGEMDEVVQSNEGGEEDDDEEEDDEGDDMESDGLDEEEEDMSNYDSEDEENILIEAMFTDGFAEADNNINSEMHNTCDKFDSAFDNISTSIPPQKHTSAPETQSEKSLKVNSIISEKKDNDNDDCNPSAGEIEARTSTKHGRMVYLYYSGNSAGMIQAPAPTFLGDNSVPDAPDRIGCLGGGLLSLPSHICSPSREGINDDNADLIPQVWSQRNAIDFVVTQLQRRCGDVHWADLVGMPMPSVPPEPPQESLRGEMCDMWTADGDLRDWCVPIVFKLDKQAEKERMSMSKAAGLAGDKILSQLAASVKSDLRRSKIESWTLDESVFAPRKRSCDSKSYWDDVGAYKRALRSDWTHLLQKDEFEHWCENNFQEGEDPTELLSYLESGAYKMLCNTYRWYSSMGLPDDLFMASNEFSLIIQDAHVADPQSEKCKISNIDVVVVSVISSRYRIPVEEPKIRTNAPPSAFVRFRKDKCLLRCEYLEVLLRVAALKYLPDETTTVAGAFKLLMERCFYPVYQHEHVLNPDNFRNERLYFSSVDHVLKDGMSITKRLFEHWTGEHRWEKFGGKKGRMTLREWNGMWRSMGMFGPNFTKREAQLGFKMSVMHVNNDVGHWPRAVTLDFPSFLEALARVAEMIVIPTEAQLAALGASDIFEFYDVMMACPHLWDAVLEEDDCEEDDQTQLKLWVRQGSSGVAGGDADNYRKHKRSTTGKGDSKSKHKYDVRPLSTKMEQLLVLLAGFDCANANRQNEQRLWTGSKPKGGKGVHRNANTDETETAKKMVQLEFQEEASRIPEGDTFELAVATRLHEAWTSQRGKQSNGLVAPCIKVIHGKKVDIANLAFADLPSTYKLDNLLSAHAACESIRWAWHQYIRHLAEAKIRKQLQKDISDPRREGSLAANAPRRSRPSQIGVEPGRTETHVDREAFYRFLQATEFIEPAAEIQHAQYVKRQLPQVTAANNKKLAAEEEAKKKAGGNVNSSTASMKGKAVMFKPKFSGKDSVSASAEKEAKEREEMLVQQLVDTPYCDLPLERKQNHRLVVVAAVDAYIERDKRIAIERAQQQKAVGAQVGQQQQQQQQQQDKKPRRNRRSMSRGGGTPPPSR